MFNSRQISRGSITLVALSLAIVIGISLASYLALCQQSLLLSTRTIQLSKARQLAETGLEEALWSLNAAANPNTSVSAIAWTNASWSADPTAADRSCILSGFDLGNGAVGQVTVVITNFDGPKAAVSSPVAAAAVPAPVITTNATITVPGFGVFSRTLTATARPAPLFPNALGVTIGYNGRILFSSGGLVDSWDSDYLGNAPLGPLSASTPNRDYIGTTDYPGTSPVTSPVTILPIPYATSSPTSTYPSASFNYAAVVAAPNITLNNAEIRGYVTTFGNPIAITAGSKVVAPPPAGTPPVPANIDSVRVGESAFVPIFNVTAPSGAAFGTLDGTTTIIDNSGGSSPRIMDASTTDLTLNGTTVTVKGHVIIRITGDLDLIYGGRIIIYEPASPGPETGRLEIFAGGNIRIGGATSSVAGFANDTNEPKRLALYSTSTSPSRTFRYYTTLPFCGVMYSAAPSNAKIEFLAINPKIYGAILANYSIEFSGTPEIHYDTALQYLPKGWFKGVTTPFILDQVTETVTP